MSYHYKHLVRPVQADLLDTADKRADSQVLNDCLDILDNNPKHNNIGVKTISKELETGGLDWLSLSTYGEFKGIDYESLIDALRDCKKAAAIEDEENSYFYGVGGHTIQVGPYGVGKGAGRCEFLLKIDGISFGLTGKKISEEQKPNLYIVIPSMPLMQYGMRDILRRLNSLLNTLGYHPKEMKVSRADFCVDLPGIEQSYFSNSYRRGKIICRSQTYQEIGKSLKSQTLKLGAAQADITCRIYDKIEEMKNNPEKEEILRKKRIGKAEVCTRVEFQVRKKALRKNFEIESLQDLLRTLESVTEYLTTKWIRISTRVVSRTNTASEKISKKWKIVQAAFQKWTTGYNGVTEFVKTIKTTGKKLARQAIGCLLKGLALDKRIPKDKNDIPKLIHEYLVDEYKWNSEEFIFEGLEKMYGELIDKRRKIEAMQPTEQILIQGT